MRCTMHILEGELKGVHSNLDQNWAQEMSELLAEYKKYADKKRSCTRVIDQFRKSEYISCI